MFACFIPFVVFLSRCLFVILTRINVKEKNRRNQLLFLYRAKILSLIRHINIRLKYFGCCVLFGKRFFEKIGEFSHFNQINRSYFFSLLFLVKDFVLNFYQTTQSVKILQHNFACDRKTKIRKLQNYKTIQIY